MNTSEWDHLVKRESARIEWKKNVANPQNVVKTLSAFANDFQQVGGGRVVCGLEEDKNESGQAVARAVGLDEKRFKEVKNKVLEYCHRYVDPPLTPDVSEYPVPNDPSRRILVFAVTSSRFAHRYRTKSEDVNYYVRVNDETRAANGLIPQLLERKKVWPPFLDQTHPDAALDHVDLRALKEFLGKKNLPHDPEKYLEPDIRFRGDVECLVTHPPGGSSLVVPRNFTLLLFGKEPHRFFRGAYAILSVYHGKDKTSTRSQRFVLHGPIPALIRDLMARLQAYMGMDIDKSQSFMNGNPNKRRYSEPAIQEAIVNAFVHRDYHSHEPVRVTVFEDRIDVTSPGGPFAPIDRETIKKGETYTAWRNPSLAWFMVEMEYAQNEGQGIRLIIRHTLETTGREPEFTISSHWFQVAIPAFNPLLVPLPPEAEVDLEIDLPVLRTGFDHLKNALTGIDSKLDGEFNKVEDALDEISFKSDENKLIKPLNKIGRLLKRLIDENSDWYPTIKNSKENRQSTGELTKIYNKFAQWLALPQVPDFLIEKKK